MQSTHIIYLDFICSKAVCLDNEKLLQTMACSEMYKENGRRFLLEHMECVLIAFSILKAECFGFGEETYMRHGISDSPDASESYGGYSQKEERY